MDLYQTIKTLHIISSAILFGTGLGIAFFMYRSHFTNSLHEKYYAAYNTVMADTFFTFPAVVIQPLSGFWLVLNAGYDLTSLWLLISYGLYLLAGTCWLPVVWLQFQLKKILSNSINSNTPLPDVYYRYFRWWFFLGWPAFLSLVAIFFLMVFKPV